MRASKTIQSIIEKAKKEIFKEMPIMEGSAIEVRKNTPSTAQAIKAHVFGEDSDVKIDDKDYYTISFNKDIDLEDGGVISKVVRVHVEDGDIVEVFESK